MNPMYELYNIYPSEILNQIRESEREEIAKNPALFLQKIICDIKERFSIFRNDTIKNMMNGCSEHQYGVLYKDCDSLSLFIEALKESFPQLDAKDYPKAFRKIELLETIKNEAIYLEQTYGAIFERLHELEDFQKILEEVIKEEMPN